MLKGRDQITAISNIIEIDYLLPRPLKSPFSVKKKIKIHKPQLILTHFCKINLALPLRIYVRMY